MNVYKILRKFKKENIPLYIAKHSKDLTPYLKEIYYGKREAEYDQKDGIVIFANPKNSKSLYALQIAKSPTFLENFWVALIYCKYNDNAARRYKRAINIIKAGANKAPEEAAKILLLRGLNG